MNTKLSKTALLAAMSLPLAMLTTIALALRAQSGTQLPATTTIGSTGSIRNDGYDAAPHSYPDSINCVDSRVDATSGFTFFRTTKLDCTMPAVQRRVNLEFSDAIVRTPDGSGSDSCHVNDAVDQDGELNICGSNLIPEVRFIAGTMFRSNALTRGTSVTMPISLVRSYQRTAFELAFEDELPVTLNATSDPGVRIISVTSAVAELYKTRARGGRISIGRFRMSFTVTVQKTGI